MGYFNFFNFKDNDAIEKEKQSIPWVHLNNMEQLNEIVEVSKDIPVVIFKYSTTCGVSRIALRNFESNFTLDPKNIKLYFLDLLAYRAISNEIADKFKVIHQSPQIIVIKNGASVYNASHHYIDASDLSQFTA
jgi:monothiol bacilliredoxin